MTLFVRISVAKMSPPNDGDTLDNWENSDGDIDRWENDGGMSFGTINDRSRKQTIYDYGLSYFQLVNIAGLPSFRLNTIKDGTVHTILHLITVLNINDSPHVPHLHAFL